jgi:hypothetical protein
MRPDARPDLRPRLELRMRPWLDTAALGRGLIDQISQQIARCH